MVRSAVLPLRKLKKTRQEINPEDTWPMLKRISSNYLWPRRKDLAWAMVAMLITAVCLSLQAHLIQPLFDNGLIDRKIGVLNTVIIFVLCLTLIRGIASYYQAYYMESVGQRLVAELQEQMYAHTLRQHLGFFAQHPTGTLTSRFVSDLQRLKYAITQIFNSGLRDTGTIIGLFTNMLLQDFKLTLLAMVVLPLSIVPIRRFGRLTRKYSRVNQEGTARLNHVLAQTFQHIRQVQSFTNEAAEQSRVSSRIHEVLGTTLKAVRVRAISSPVVEMIGTGAIAILMFYAARRIADSTLSPGSFASFIASLIMLTRPLKGLTSLNNNLQEGLAAAQRAFDLIDLPLTLTEAPGAKPLKVKHGEIRFENASLAYPDGTLALKDLSLTIPAGSTVAFVGPSGAGKTSLLNLLPRFYDLSAGTITIDGQNLHQVTLRSLREHIALVSQDVAIFDDSITANIGYGSPHATAKKIHAAARAAAADEFINALPDGYATVLGENGLKLSGGQKQRLAIARALVKDAPILLLDEATASLDTQSERQVQTALEQLMTGRTTLVVAHRLSTIVKADMIVVLDGGKIVETGTHTTLLTKKHGLYARLWRLQGGAAALHESGATLDVESPAA